MKCPKCGKTTFAILGACRHCGKRLPGQNKQALQTPARRAGLSQRQLLIAGGIGLSLLAALLIAILYMGEKRREIKWRDQEIRIERIRDDREIAANAVWGRVIAHRQRENRRGTMAVRSLLTGKEYTFFVGWRTSYHPRRYPAIGEQVKVYYLFDKGLMEATQVVIGE
jgi:hypothetical protein